MHRRSVVGLCLAVLAVSANAQAPSRGGERAADPGDKMICKRFTETGSLVRSYRTCKTKRDWERDRDSAVVARSGSGCNDAGPACR